MSAPYKTHYFEDLTVGQRETLADLLRGESTLP